MAYLKTQAIVALLLHIIGLAAQTSAAMAQSSLTISDRGHDIFLPLGEVSFADRVVDFAIGTPAAQPEHSDPYAILGRPDGSGTEAVTLGCGGAIIIAFDDNLLVDIKGPDLYVFEVGPAVEPTYVSISETGEIWHDLGRIEGSTAAIDIAHHIPNPDGQFHLVWLRDAKTGCSGSWPGADLNAIAAIGTIAVEKPGDAGAKHSCGASETHCPTRRSPDSEN